MDTQDYAMYHVWIHFPTLEERIKTIWSELESNSGPFASQPTDLTTRPCLLGLVNLLGWVDDGHGFKVAKSSHQLMVVVLSVLKSYFEFQGFPHIPDYRLRAIVRTFIKSLINKCPHRYFAAVVAPLLHHLMPFMLRRLTEKWNQVRSFLPAPVAS